MNITKCKLCKREFNRLSRHVRQTHGIEYRDYLVEHEYGGLVPKCACGGCDEDAPYTRSQGESFKKYVHGHHARVRVRSEEERQKIGEKNSVNMTRFFEENPEIGLERNRQLRSGITEEIEERRIEKSNVWKRSDDGRKIASLRLKKTWSENREMMEEAAKQGGQTARDGFASGRLVRTEEQKDAISSSITQKYLDGGFQWSRGKHISSKLLGRDFAYYRSSWELRHMMEMDTDQTVVSYQYEPHSIYYEFDGRTRRYVPDFLVKFSDGHLELQEVGVKSVKALVRNVQKQEAGRKWASSQENCQFKLVVF